MTRATPLPPDERRRAIIAATRPLLIAGGATFTTRQVAEAAGIAEGTIFRVFDSKADLLSAVIEDTLDPAALCRAIAQLPPQPNLDLQLTRLIGLLQAHVGTIAAVMSALHQAPPEQVSHHRAHETAARHERSRTVIGALAESLTPWETQLQIPRHQAASLLRGLALASAHPLLSDPDLTDPATIAKILLSGIQLPTPQEDPHARPTDQ